MGKGLEQKLGAKRKTKLANIDFDDLPAGKLFRFSDVAEDLRKVETPVITIKLKDGQIELCARALHIKLCISRLIARRLEAFAPEGKNHSI